jgi:hypothetical protein
MPVYSVTFSAVAVSAQQDLFEIVSPAAGIIEIHGFELFQTSDHGDAAAEGLQLLWVRGHATSGSGGSSFTPVLRSGKDGAAAATCEINNTTIASTGTAVNYSAGGFNVQAGFERWYPPEVRPVLRNSERGVLRCSAPADALTMSGTLYYEEL